VVDPIWITSTFIPFRLFMMDSLAEHVPGPVSTKTRGRLSVGSGYPGGVENPTVVE